MGHQLDFTKGVAAIAYTGAEPWHGYGQELQEGQPLEVWLQEAGLDYNVIEKPIAWCPEDEENNFANGWSEIIGKKVLARDDNLAPLAVVTDRYQVVQPKEVLYFFEDLIESQGFKMHTAGALADGKRVWALAETGESFHMPGTTDEIGAYLLLATSYDGKFSTTAQFTSIRVVCNNTLGFSLKRGESQDTGIVRIPHFSEFSADDVKGELGLFGQGWKKFQDNVIQLSEVKITKRQAVEFFLELLGVTEEQAAEGKQLQNAKKLIAFYESAPGSEFVTSKNTTWGLVNAVSFFADHGRRAHNNGTRFDSASFGEGARLKQKAFDSALKVAEAA